MELRLCPQLTGYFTLPNIEWQSSSLLPLQVMYSVHEMMKHCLNMTLRFWGFFCITFLALCQEYLAFFLENFYYVWSGECLSYNTAETGREGPRDNIILSKTHLSVTYFLRLGPSYLPVTKSTMTLSCDQSTLMI